VIWLFASVLVVVAAPFVLWPLLTHWQPEPEPPSALDAEREHQLEEVELDLASGRISRVEAARRSRELS
jgi:cytochrome c-type biogenesis protein CcmI